MLDLEYALDKKVEQELWTFGFKNHITTLQELTRDKKVMFVYKLFVSLHLLCNISVLCALELFTERIWKNNVVNGS